MFVDPALNSRRQPGQPGSEQRVAWSVLVPFFNERDCLDLTLESLGAQSVRPRVILIDNASTDGSAAIATAACHRLGLDHELLVETRPGKVAALALGLTRVATPYVATCDADTWYPPRYLAEAQRILERGNAVAGAFFVPHAADERARRRQARRIATTAMLLRGQCHTGGAGQAFRTDALRRAGGFDPHRWGYVLEDHEVIHRVMKHGAMGYGYRLWCCPSPRERDRASIRWTLAERLLYCIAAPVAGDWFFYRFLAVRLRARRLTSERIRERQFQDVGRTPRTMPALILCADDFAHSTDTSRVIADLLAARRLTATGCMTLRPNWPDDSRMLRDIPDDRAIGLHLVLTDEAPLTAMPRLAPGGTLPHLHRLERLAEPDLALDEIAAEVDAQFERFAGAVGRPPAFVDGHQHAHALPRIRDLVIAATRRHAPAAWLRSCEERPMAMLARPWRGKAFASALHSRGLNRAAAARGVATNRGFAGHYGFAGDYAAIFPAFLRRPGPRHLVMCHPGADTRRGDAIAAARPVEAAALRALPLGELAAAHGLVPAAELAG